MGKIKRYFNEPLTRKSLILEGLVWTAIYTAAAGGLVGYGLWKNKVIEKHEEETIKEAYDEFEIES